MSLAEVTGKPSGLPKRYVLYGAPGIGKTSFGAYAPSPIFIQSKGETGLDSLIEAGLLPETPHFPECQTWPELFALIETLTNEDHPYRTLVIDTLNGCEKICHDEVTRRDFKGIAGRGGFVDYQNGAETAATVDWRSFLAALDRLREVKGMAILCLAHMGLAKVPNPQGPDYEKYGPALHKYTWSHTERWADAILFCQFETFVDSKDGKKGKAKGGKTRMMFTADDATFVAKNRMGLPLEIDMGSSGQEAWNNFAAALKSSKQANGKDGN